MLERAASQPEEITNMANVKERCIHGLYEAGARWEAGGATDPLSGCSSSEQMIRKAFRESIDHLRQCSSQLTAEANGSSHFLGLCS